VYIRSIIVSIIVIHVTYVIPRRVQLAREAITRSWSLKSPYVCMCVCVYVCMCGGVEVCRY
jgi:cytochrome c oxidase assembly factor CtaG